MPTLTRTSTGLLFRDDFARADGAPGGNYAVINENGASPGTWLISGGVLVNANNRNGDSLRVLPGALASAPAGSMTMQAVGSQGLAGAGLLALNGGTSPRGILAYLENGNAYLFRHDGAAYIAISGPVSFPTGSAIRTKLVQRPGRQELYTDGVLRLTGAATQYDALGGSAALRTTTSTPATTTYDDLAVCSANTLTVSGLTVGQTVRAGGLTSAAAGISGIASLDLAGTALPAATVEVLDGGGAVAATYSGEVWGGDVYAFAPDIPPGNLPPSAPEILNPAPGDTRTPLAPIAFTDSTDPNGDPITYTAQIRPSGGAWQTVNAAFRSGYAVDFGAARGAVEVRVGASDPYEGPIWSAPVAFTVVDSTKARLPSVELYNLWASGSYVVHLDVEVERPSGGGSVMQSYRLFSGRNWIRSVRLNMPSVEQPIGSGTVTFAREASGLLLSHLVTGSALNTNGGLYAPALDFGRDIRIRVALTAPGQEPEAGDWWVLFEGFTDDVNWGGRDTNAVTMDFRDRSGRLSDTYPREKKTYGARPDGIATEVVAQEIVNDGVGAGQETVTSHPAPPSFMVREYPVEGVSTWAALETLALAAGGLSVRQRWNATAGGYRLTLVQPPRDKVAVDYAVPPTVYVEVHALSTNGKNIRTIVRGRALAEDGRTVLEKQIPAEADVATDPLVLKYGQRALLFSETSTIDTQAELDEMVEAIYADVSTGTIPVEVETRFCPWADSDDVVEWVENGLLWDQPLRAAVLAVSHDLSEGGKARTRFRCSGTPKGAYGAWLRREVSLTGVFTTAGEVFTTHTVREDTADRRAVTLVASHPDATVHYNVDGEGWGSKKGQETVPVDVSKGRTGIVEYYSTLGRYSEELRVLHVDANPNPEIKALTVTETAPFVVTAALELDDDITHWQLWAKKGARPVLASGEPDNDFLRAYEDTSQDDTSFTVTAGTWYVVVRAYGANGQYAPREESVVVTGSPAGYAALSDLAASLVTVAGENRAQVTWTHNAAADDGAHRVEVRVDGVTVLLRSAERDVRTDADGATPGAALAGGFTHNVQWVDAGAPGAVAKTWPIQVRLYGATGYLSSYSTSVSGYASATAPPPGAPTTAPGAPVLDAGPASGGIANLQTVYANWSNPSGAHSIEAEWRAGSDVLLTYTYEPGTSFTEGIFAVPKYNVTLRLRYVSAGGAGPWSSVSNSVNLTG